MSENGKSEFWKWAEKSGRIKDVSEAFEKYPVEEEWHKGNYAIVRNNKASVKQR